MTAAGVARRALAAGYAAVPGRGTLRERLEAAERRHGPAGRSLAVQRYVAAAERVLGAAVVQRLGWEAASAAWQAMGAARAELTRAEAEEREAEAAATAEPTTGALLRLERATAAVRSAQRARIRASARLGRTGEPGAEPPSRDAIVEALDALVVERRAAGEPVPHLRVPR